MVRVRVGGDGLVGGRRGHGTCGGDRLAVHCLVADLCVGVRNGLGLDLGRVLGLVLLVLMLVLMLVLVLHLVLGNGLHRHRRTHVHVERWRGGVSRRSGVGRKKSCGGVSHEARIKYMRINRCEVECAEICKQTCLQLHRGNLPGHAAASCCQ